MIALILSSVGARHVYSYVRYDGTITTSLLFLRVLVDLQKIWFAQK